MFCLTCGTQLPDDANFCHKCGTPIGQTQSSKVTWEYCQICWDEEDSLFSGTQVWFWADAVGPEGKYNAGESPRYRTWGNTRVYGPADLSHKKDRANAEEAHNRLVQMLISDGWEPLPERGEYWWQLRFRRRVN